MADKHPYISGTGAISGALNQFKKSFPATVTAETLKKLGIAPNNESYVINTLRFIGALDPEGNRTAEAHAVFSKHDPADFQEAFAKLIKKSYADLFELHGEAAWSLDSNKLIAFFRGTDKTSDLVGRRQATTFQVLASYSGHGEIPTAKTPSAPKGASNKGSKPAAKVKPAPVLPDMGGHHGVQKSAHSTSSRDVGLTVRIEVNLPAAGDQETYDKIFRSIRENLLNAK